MTLGYDYIIIALIIIGSTLILYTLKKSTFKKNPQKKSIQSFKTELKIFLKNTFPKIIFDFTIFETVKNEHDSDIRQILIAENIALQFTQYQVKLDTQRSIKRELLWSTYEFESKPEKNKIPKDLKKRKELSFKRDNQSCVRCGRILKFENASMFYIKPIEKGGTYHFENIATACPDCKKILSSNQSTVNFKNLHLIDEILQRASF